jgi:hypothetical protein
MPNPQSSFLQTQSPGATNIAFGVGPTAQRPSNPIDGFVYSDTSLNIVVVWNSSTWLTVGSVVFPFAAGTSTGYPTSPSYPYLYWNSTTQQLSCWNGSTWVIIGPVAYTPTPVAAPQITTQPVGATVNPTNSYTFTVAATGAGVLTYQWLLNGVNIGGATASSYNIASAASANAGTYTVVVTGSGGSTASLPAVLVVTGTPVVTSNPSNQTISTGNSVTFSVLASGTAPLSYQWYQNNVAINSGTSNGGASLTLTNVPYSLNGSSYFCNVSNGSGNVNSASATLTVTPYAYKATWTSFTGVAVLQPSTLTGVSNTTLQGDVIYGFYINTATCSVAPSVTFSASSSSGSMPIGSTFTVFSSTGAAVASLTTGTNTAYPPSISWTVPVSNANASYTVVCTTTSAIVITGTITASGGGSSPTPAFFVNSAIRALIYGTQYSQNLGAGYSSALFCSSFTQANPVVNMVFYPASARNSPYSGPYAWSFNGATSTAGAPNPSNGISVGSSLALDGYAPASQTTGADAVLELDSN